jgi:hypothetical protein
LHNGHLERAGVTWAGLHPPVTLEDMNENMNKENLEEKFLRQDLMYPSGGAVSTYFRLHKELRDFIQDLIDKGYDIQGVELDLNDEQPGRAGWNIGFIIVPAEKGK